MNPKLTALALATFGMTVLTCLVSMMAVFMGGGQSSGGLGALLVLQIAAIPAALWVIAVCLSRTRAEHGWRNGLHGLWRALPQWMLLAFVILALLLVVGELSFLLLFQLTGQADPWREHVPLVSMVVCSMAFMMLYAQSRADAGCEAMVSGRWR